MVLRVTVNLEPAVFEVCVLRMVYHDQEEHGSRHEIQGPGRRDGMTSIMTDAIANINF